MIKLGTNLLLKVPLVQIFIFRVISSCKSCPLFFGIQLKCILNQIVLA